MSANEVTSLAAERERRAAQERDVVDDLSPGDDEFDWTRFWSDLDRRMFQAMEAAPGFSPAQRAVLGEILRDARTEMNGEIDGLARRIAALEAAARR
jgi:hypothetical protein